MEIEATIARQRLRLELLEKLSGLDPVMVHGVLVEVTQDFARAAGVAPPPPFGPVPLLLPAPPSEPKTRRAPRPKIAPPSRPTAPRALGASSKGGAGSDRRGSPPKKLSHGKNTGRCARVLSVLQKHGPMTQREFYVHVKSPDRKERAREHAAILHLVHRGKVHRTKVGKDHHLKLGASAG